MMAVGNRGWKAIAEKVMDSKKKWEYCIYWLFYSVLFVCVSAVVFYPFIKDGRSFVHRVDGLDEQYNSLLYFHRWGRQIWETFRTTGKWVIPAWEFNMGLGADIFTTIFFSISPTAIGAVFCPERWLEYFYALEFLLHLYLSGISFSLFAGTWQKKKGAVLLGSFSYCFCGFVIQKGVQHTFFIMPMVLLPLVLLGVNKIYKRQSPALFVISIVVSAVSNLYFFYMIVIIVVLYVAVQYCFLEETKSIRQFFSWVGKFAFYGITGIMISASVFLPTMAAMFGSSRSGVSNDIPWLYHISYYYQLFWGICSNDFRSFDSRTGYLVISLLAVFLLLVRKGEKIFKVSLAVLTMFLCVPMIGSVFNGFGYVSNRWIFAYSLLISCIFTKMYPFFYEMTEKIIARLFCLSGVYLFLGNLLPLFGIQDGMSIYRMGIWLIVMLIAFMAIYYLRLDKRSITVLLWGGVIGGVALNAYYEYSPVYGSTISRYVNRGEVLEEYTEKLPSNQLKKIEDIGSYRSSVSAVNEIQNSYILQDIPGVEFYNSIVVGSVTRFFKEMYYNEPMEHKYNGFDSRLILDSLFGVKYYLADGQNAEMFSHRAEIEEDGGTDNYSIYKNPYVLPLVYCYDSYIPRPDWNMMSVTDKQEAMIYGAVVEECSLPETVPDFTNYEIGYEIDVLGGVEIDENCYTVKENNGSVVLRLDSIPVNSEMYVIFEGVDYEGISPVDLHAGGDLSNVRWQDRQIIRDAQVMYQEKDDIFVQVKAGQRQEVMNYFTRKHRMYCGKHDFLCNLGYMEEGSQEIELSFNDTGIYTFSNIRVVVQPYSAVVGRLSQLQQGAEAVSGWQIGINEMSGKVNCDKKQLLCIVVPYSKGWSAYVDGKKADIKQVNTACMGVELEDGEHEVRFEYCTPFLKAGVMISLLGMFVYAGRTILFLPKKLNP